MVGLLCYGTGLRVAQWIVIREHFSRAGWWPVLSTAAWALSGALILIASIAGMYQEPFDLFAAFLVPVAVSGAGLVWLFGRMGNEKLINPCG